MWFMHLVGWMLKGQKPHLWPRVSTPKCVFVHTGGSQGTSTTRSPTRARTRNNTKDPSLGSMISPRKGVQLGIMGHCIFLSMLIQQASACSFMDATNLSQTRVLEGSALATTKGLLAPMMLQRSAANHTNPNGRVAIGVGTRSLRLRGAGAVETYKGLKSVVEMFGACSLPGCTIKFDSFMTCLQRAQSRGYVKDHEGDYVADGLRNGFKLGVDFDVLRRNGRRIHKNYKSAYEVHASVSKAVKARLGKGKSVVLGEASTALREFCAEFPSLACFPMGAVLKPNQDETIPRDSWSGGRRAITPKRGSTRRPFWVFWVTASTPTRRWSGCLNRIILCG